MALREPPGVALTVSIPLRMPAAVGLKTTWTVQFPLAAMAAVQPSMLTEKSPVTFTEGLPVAVAPLLTVKVTGLALEAPTATVPKSWVAGEMLFRVAVGPSNPPSFFGVATATATSGSDERAG